MTNPDQTPQNGAARRDDEQPLSDSLLGDPDAGGLAGQGGMVDIEDDLERDDEDGED